MFLLEMNIALLRHELICWWRRREIQLQNVLWHLGW